MSDVTVIGLGEMGGALARAFLRSGRSVVVWNRTPAKALALEQQGAVRATTVAGAVSASSVVVVCLSDYAAAHRVLGEVGVAEVLRGRLVVQLTSGTPKEARALDAWTTAHGASYLDGAIAAWPNQIGGPEASIVVAGSEAVFNGAEALLKLLAANVTHVGTNISHANVLFNAALAYFAGHWVGFSHGAAICEAEGLETEMFGETMASLSASFEQDMRHMGQVIAARHYDNPESSLRTAATDIARLVEVSSDLRMNIEFPECAANIFQSAVDAGFGAEEHCAIKKVLQARAFGD